MKKHGRDILSGKNMQIEKQCLQHGRVTVYSHSIRVALLSLKLAAWLRLRVDQRAMLRGALLHDYFLYDWHVKDKSHRLHGFCHARKALHNAERDFILGEKERDIIRSHMFPLNLRSIPRCRESVLVCLADKISALEETLLRR